MWLLLQCCARCDADVVSFLAVRLAALLALLLTFAVEYKSAVDSAAHSFLLPWWWRWWPRAKPQPLTLNTCSISTNVAQHRHQVSCYIWPQSFSNWKYKIHSEVVQDVAGQDPSLSLDEKAYRYLVVKKYTSRRVPCIVDSHGYARKMCVAMTMFRWR